MNIDDPRRYIHLKRRLHRGRCIHRKSRTHRSRCHHRIRCCQHIQCRHRTALDVAIAINLLTIANDFVSTIDVTIANDLTNAREFPIATYFLTANDAASAKYLTEHSIMPLQIMSSVQRMSPSQKRSPSQKMWFSPSKSRSVAVWGNGSASVLKRPLHITVHREIPAQIDEVVLCGHRHYAKIFPVSNWLFEIHGLGGAFAADTPNGCFRPQPMQNSVRSGRLLAALHPGCATQVPRFFPPGCVVLSGGRPRGNHHRRIHSREEIPRPRQRRRSPSGHELTKKCTHFNSLHTTETVFHAGSLTLFLYI